MKLDRQIVVAVQNILQSVRPKLRKFVIWLSSNVENLNWNICRNAVLILTFPVPIPDVEKKLS